MDTMTKRIDKSPMPCSLHGVLLQRTGIPLIYDGCAWPVFDAHDPQYMSIEDALTLSPYAINELVRVIASMRTGYALKEHASPKFRVFDVARLPRGRFTFELE